MMKDLIKQKWNKKENILQAFLSEEIAKSRAWEKSGERKTV